MDDGQGWRDCFSASSAMLAAYWHKISTEDAYNSLRQRYGDSTSAEAQLDALRQLGLQADFRTDGTEADLQREIDAGRPVAVGWLHHGPSSDPSGGGHWTVVIGYDATGVVMNDPYGNCDLVNGGYPSNHDGAGLHYSYRNWLPRWRVGGTGGWMLLCRP
jgi:ABC-type bacteriocin/lantibiotic exporter with double-glycine peptidase domain